MPPELTLHTISACPYCIRVKKHLARLNLEYEEVRAPRIRSLRREVRRISGQKRVPVLVDGGHVVADSQVICDYLTAHYSAAVGSESPDAQPA